MTVAQNSHRSPAEGVLATAQGDRIAIQDFCPLADSIEWQLGQRYLQEQGTKAFLSDARPVPYVVNNDGVLSRNAAEVFFTSLVQAEKSDSLGPEIFALELGIGVGLFARYFLDAFRDLCIQNGKDYYGRLCYIAADRSEQMLRDACRHGVFANHAGRYVLRVIDALRPEESLGNDVMLRRAGPRPLRAVFLNYLLDCLPASVLEVADNEIRQLCVRTCLARGTDLSEHTDLTAEQLAQRSGSAKPRDQQDLLEVYGLFASEYAYRPVNIREMPYGDFAFRFADGHGDGTRSMPATLRVLHNYGAIQCLERLMPFLHDNGFILINDYGPTEVAPAEEYEHQRFSHATFIGVNFPLLKTYFADKHKKCWVETPEENPSVHSRLLGHQPAQETIASFQERFTKKTLDWLSEPAKQAREWAKVGRFEAAAGCYQQALERQPQNWVLLNEIAHFLTFTLRNLKAGIDMAKVGLSLNPTSSELWNTLGDGLFEFGRVAEARSAYLRALQFSPNDVRSHYNLAWVYGRERNYPAALQEIAEALALDPTGEYHERLLAKQSEILQRLGQRKRQEYLRLVNRISTAGAAGNSNGPFAGKADKAEGVKGMQVTSAPLR